MLSVSCKKDENPGAHFHKPLAHPENGPAAGNPDGHYPIPDDAAAEDVSIETAYFSITAGNLLCNPQFPWTHNQ